MSWCWDEHFACWSLLHVLFSCLLSEDLDWDVKPLVYCQSLALSQRMSLLICHVQIAVFFFSMDTNLTSSPSSLLVFYNCLIDRHCSSYIPFKRFLRFPHSDSQQRDEQITQGCHVLEHSLSLTLVRHHVVSPTAFLFLIRRSLWSIIKLLMQTMLSLLWESRLRLEVRSPLEQKETKILTASLWPSGLIRLSYDASELTCTSWVQSFQNCLRP